MSEMSIGNKSEVQINWEQNAPINAQLRKVVEPLTRQFNDEMRDRLADSTPEDREALIADTGNIYTLPYGRVGMLPPALFGEINEKTIVLKRRLVVPRTNRGMNALLDDYFNWAEVVTQQEKYEWWAHPRRDVLEKAMIENKGLRYPREQWMQSALEMQRALRNEPVFIMDSHRTTRIVNAGFDHDQLNKYLRALHRPYKSYVLVMTQKETPDNGVQGTRDYVQLPIGEYGVNAAGRLARVTLALNEYVRDDSAIDTYVRNMMNPEMEKLLAEYTARTQERHEASMPEAAIHGVKNTLTEGILSISQTIAFLTAEKVEGYDSHGELVKDILNSDVIEQFTRLVEAGYIGPSTLSGLYIPNALAIKNGKLALGNETVSFLNAVRKHYVARIAAGWAAHRASNGEVKHPSMLGLVCPAAAPKGAISMAKEAFKLFY